MEKFKFKAWDKENERMVDIDGNNLYLADGKVYEVYEGTWCYSGYMEKKDVSDRYIPLMYTGFKDKNGEEIYSGDVYNAGLYTKEIRPELFVEDTYELIKMLVAGAAVEVIGNLYSDPDFSDNGI